MNVTEDIKIRLDIVDIITETVKLRRTGKNYIGFCPFHPNTRTPAFVVFPETGTWRCFGQCNEGGDLFRFVMKKEGLDFPETLRILADRAGVRLVHPTPHDEEQKEANEGMRQLLEDSVVFYRHQLEHSPAGQPALEYLYGRGVTREAIETFEIGFSPNSWDQTGKYLLEKGYQVLELVETGMVTERDDGGWHDRFRNRIMFPIRDERGRMTGFGARILNPDDVPKFLNSPQTPVFDKGSLLYGLTLARKPIRSQNQAIIVEGYLDVVALHQAGFSNAVSPMGTALTEFQLRKLKRYSRNIVLALDADAAGEKAVIRGLEVARQSLDREHDFVFNAVGLLQHESRINADIRVSTLPDGLDPDDVVNRDSKQWQEIISNAQPIVYHVIDSLIKDQDLDDPKVKKDIALKVLPLIDDVADPIERDAYRQSLARKIRLDERVLSQYRIPKRRGTLKHRADNSDHLETETGVHEFTDKQNALTKLEGHCLGIFMRQPDMIYTIDRMLLTADLNRISHHDFQNTDHQILFELIRKSIDQTDMKPWQYVQSNLSLPLMDIADILLGQTGNLNMTQDRLVQDVLRTLLDMRLSSLRQDNDQIRFMMEDDQLEGMYTESPYIEIMKKNIELKKRLDHARTVQISNSSLRV